MFRSRLHCGRIQIDTLFAKANVDPAAIVAAEEFQFVTTEAMTQSLESRIAFLAVLLVRNALRTRGAAVFRNRFFTAGHGWRNSDQPGQDGRSDRHSLRRRHASEFYGAQKM
jgi:hypothetical protein